MTANGQYPSWLYSWSAIVVLILWTAGFTYSILNPTYSPPSSLHVMALGTLGAIHGAKFWRGT